MDFLKNFIDKKFYDDYTRFNLIKSQNANIDNLLNCKAYPYDGWESVFVKAMQEIIEWHAKKNAIFCNLLKENNFSPDSMSSLEGIENMPWIFAGEFKQRKLASISENEAVFRVTSSGTQGNKTWILLDNISLNRLLTADYKIHNAMGLLNQSEPCNIQIFTGDIKDNPNLGMVFSSYAISDMTHYKKRRAVISLQNGTDVFEIDKAAKDYLEFVESGLPIRWIGFPMFMYKLLNYIKDKGLPKAPKPDESWIQTSGGWKSHEDISILNSEFASLAEEIIGIPASNIRDLYGASEHGVGYLECKFKRKHISAFAHAVTRNPYTFKITKNNEPGLLHLYSPLLLSRPSMSLLINDLAVIDDKECPCGCKSKSIQVLRRVGLKDYETCAIRMLEVIDS